DALVPLLPGRAPARAGLVERQRPASAQIETAQVLGLARAEVHDGAVEVALVAGVREVVAPERKRRLVSVHARGRARRGRVEAGAQEVVVVEEAAVVAARPEAQALETRAQVARGEALAVTRRVAALELVAREELHVGADRDRAHAGERALERGRIG